MYTCHLYRRSLVTEIEGFRVNRGSQDYDLVLRLTEKTENIFHIPKVLYHWRIIPNLLPVPEAKPYAYMAAEKLFQMLCRRGENGITRTSRFLGLYRYKIETYKLVSIIIPTKDLGETLINANIYFHRVYTQIMRVVVIDNGSEEEYTAKVINH